MARSSSPRWVRYLPLIPLLLAAVLVGSSLMAQGGAPNIEVRDGVTVINPGGNVNFTNTQVGVVNSKTFTVRNTGTANLLVSEVISVPQGFTLMASLEGVPNALFGPNTDVSSLAAFTLVPNATATFTVALNSATAGNFGGQVSFRTNVAGRDPFVFNVTGQVQAPPSVRIADDNDAAFTNTAGWFSDYTEVGPSGRTPYQGYLTWANPGTGTEVGTWTFTGLQPGQYEVAATWVGYPWGATNAPFRVYNGGTQVGSTVRVNQTADSAGFTDGGAVWQILGNFTITGSTLAVTLADDANSWPNADAVRIRRVSASITSQTKDDSEGFDFVEGTWFPGYTEPGHGDHLGTVTWAEPFFSSGAPASVWHRFTVTPGRTYRVLVGFNGYPWAATNTPFFVFDGDTINLTPAGVRVNQTVTPLDEVGSGVGWRVLGIFPITTNTVWVGCANYDANSWPFTDAVRIDGGETPSEYDTVRFLQQATWGPTDALIAQVRTSGFNAYLNQQLYAAPSGYPPLPFYNTNDNITNNNTTSCYGDPAVAGNPARAACLRDNYGMYPLQLRFFSNALYGDDQFRQRMLWALHKIWVVSGVDVRQPSWMTPYLQILDRNAFGNFRTLMYEMTLNPAMGVYLDMNGSTATRPNENYTRELLQLFCTGLNELNPDGKEKTDGSGNFFPTYNQDLINNITKVYTGWNLAVVGNPPALPPGVNVNYRDPMRLNGAIAENPVNHDWTQKNLLRGFVIPAQPTAGRTVANAYLELNQSLDNIYNNPNVAPFISKQVIQQLVTSNPSPGYVARVADVFTRNKYNANQLAEVARAILLDPEARGDRKVATNYGHLKEPALYINNLMRLFDARSADRVNPSDGYLNPQSVNLGQDVYRPPSVFSYFPPDQVVEQGPPPVLGPEFGGLTTTTVLRRANFINAWAFFNFGTGTPREQVQAAGTTPAGVYPPGHPQAGQPLVPTGFWGTAVTVDPLLALAGNPPALADELNRLMLHGTMTPEMKAEIVSAVNAVAGTNPRKRVRTAVYLIATSAQYQVQK